MALFLPKLFFSAGQEKVVLQSEAGDEMDQLHTRLKQMEGQKEMRTSKSLQKPASYHKYKSGHEERKLDHLRNITHLLVEGRLLEDLTPEVEAEETLYSADWEGYPEETFPQYEVLLCRHRYTSFILEEPYGDILTPEELAERMEREDEADEKNKGETEELKDESSDDGPKGMAGDAELKWAQLCEQGEEADNNEDDADEEGYKQDEEEEEEVGEDQPCLIHYTTDEEETPNSPGHQKEGETSRRRRLITFSNHRHVFHYPKEGAVGCSYEDEEVVEDVPEDDEEEEEKKQDQGDDLQAMEDPLMEAERLGFSIQFTCDPAEQEVDLCDFLLTYQPEAVINSDQSGAAEAPRLRMRYKNHQKEK